MLNLVSRVEDAMGEYRGGVELPPSFSGKPDPTVMSASDLAPPVALSEEALFGIVEKDIEKAEEQLADSRSDTAQISEDWGGW